ncbi:MAG: hypothetical protein ACQ9MH_02075 [Nitrospinales bacterium]
MNLKKIECELLNGFHDAYLKNIQVDYCNRKVILDLDISIGDPDANDKESREKYRLGQIIITNFLYCVIEPPDSNYSFQESKPLWIDGGHIEEILPPPLPSGLLPKSLPDDAFVYWFFVRDWNSYIYIAGIDARLIWQD